MRLATRHPQVSRNHNGKFYVSTNPTSEYRQVRNHQLPNVEAAPPVAPVAFPSYKLTPTTGHPGNVSEQQQGPTLLGDRFLLLGPAECSTLIRCVDVQTGQQLVAKALTPGDKATDALLQAHLRLEGTDAVSSVCGVVDAGRKRYLLLEGHHGDLHDYVRARRRLREPEARRLFRQVVKAVVTCHENGVVLRDLKLRKFVFADEARTKLRVECLEDAVLVDADDDKLSDRRGCPAYVAPEVLRSGRAYSGKGADIWSLGVLLYTMLAGRYPFNDIEHASLFAKISRAHFFIPENCPLSPRAKCLIKALLRREPTERPVAEDVLRHPWLTKPVRHVSHSQSFTGCGHYSTGSTSRDGRSSSTSNDQIVPEVFVPQDGRTSFSQD